MTLRAPHWLSACERAIARGSGHAGQMTSTNEDRSARNRHLEHADSQIPEPMSAGATYRRSIALHSRPGKRGSPPRRRSGDRPADGGARPTSQITANPTAVPKLQTRRRRTRVHDSIGADRERYVHVCCPTAAAAPRKPRCVDSVLAGFSGAAAQRLHAETAAWSGIRPFSDSSPSSVASSWNTSAMSSRTSNRQASRSWRAADDGRPQASS